MGKNQYPPFSIKYPTYHWTANIIKTNKSVTAGGFFNVVSINGQSGRLGQVNVNLDSQTALRLQIERDGRYIVNHTPEDIEDTGAGDLALEIPNAINSILQTTKSASNNYAMAFMGHLLPCDFKNSLDVRIINDSSSAVDIQALYAIWGILGWIEP